MNATLLCPAAVLLSAFVTAAEPPAEIALDRPGIRITQSARIRPGVYPLPGDKVVVIEGNGITVDFQGAELVGAGPTQMPDTYTGTGVLVRGANVTVRNAKIRGYKVGIHAEKCPGFTAEDLDVSGNFQQRLLSTPEAEDSSDWLWPHHNDKNEWATAYGAGLYVEDSDRVTIRRVRARNGQNGIILDCVNDSKVYDNDCSFLSGWGLAMWRSNRNVVSRNAFDFCVRGYSHGVYNRGQDSAGILFFEQCSNNVIAENSATHGGDGLFGFAGREALGESLPPSRDFDYTRRGCNDNLLIANDFSYAPAHGIEMTFSFGNKFIGNRLVKNAICGVWGGYSQDTLIADNQMEGNGEGAYGLERGGVNIEQGTKNVIVDNTFRDNKCGVHFWGNPNADFLQRPWGKANYKGSTGNVVANNTFQGDLLVLHLRNSQNTLLAGNKLERVAKEVDATPGSEPRKADTYYGSWQKPEYPVYGETRPVGARARLRGREKIIITPWGPYDHETVVAIPSGLMGRDKAQIQVLGPEGTFEIKKVTGDVKASPRKGPLPSVVVVSTDGDGYVPFSLDIEAGGKTLTLDGGLMRAQWDVRFFRFDPTSEDPRKNAEAWAKIIAGPPLEQRTLSAIDFTWGGRAPGDKVPGDYFGTVATTAIELPAGTYEVWTVSDDGIRVWVDDSRVIDDWTHHVPTRHAARVDLKEGRHTIRVEHFELNGMAQLQVRIQPVK
jgi:hypothetical protein